MLKLGRVTKVKVFFLVLAYVFNFDLFEFSTAILEKGLLSHILPLFTVFIAPATALFKATVSVRALMAEPA